MAERIDRNLRIRKTVPNNPRQEQTHGWYAWECIRDGMTVQEYLDAPYDPDAFIRQKGRSNRPFTGPAILHLETDLENGFIELYQHANVATRR